MKWRFAAAALTALVGLGLARPTFAVRATDDPPCPEGEHAVGWLGFSQIDCNCTYDEAAGEEPIWRFRGEPRIHDIDPDGPAHGKLQDGDRLFAIDSYHITTEEAGRRFANPEPGKPMEITVKRRGSTQTVRIVPRQVCESDPRLEALHMPHALAEPGSRDEWETPAPAAPRTPLPPSAPTPRAAPEPEAPRTPRPPRAPEAAPRAREASENLPPSGWFGVGLSCSDCNISRDRDEGVLLWKFRTPPTIYSVDRGSPAQRAGILRGDVLTHVDDVRITTADGGERFSRTRPGDDVRWTVRRDGRNKTFTLVAGEHPDRRDERKSDELLSMLRDLEGLENSAALKERVQRLSELAQELAEQAKHLPRVRAFRVDGDEGETSEITPEPDGSSRHMRYTGTMGDYGIQVVGPGSVVVTETHGDTLTIDVGGTTIRIERKAKRE